jgi:hypothetical protein
LLASVLLPLAHLVDRHETDTSVLSRELFGTWVWPFEVLSLLLLVALVAALAVSRVGAPRSDVPGAAPRGEAELQGAREHRS